MNKFLTILILSVLTFTTAKSQSQTALKTKPVQELVYKEASGRLLKLSFYHPADFDANKKYPTMIFFFGGGWIGGSITQFEDQALYFASRGMITILADYRVKKTDNTSPFDAVKDAKSAMRYIKIHANELHIDTDKIVAAGGSAGGHLAAATTLLSGLNEEGEDVSISTKANALVLFNPVIDNGPNGYGYERIGDRYMEISPLHAIEKGAPPTIFFLGTKDKHIPVATAEAYKAKMEAIGSRCDLFLYENQEHGFFNKGKKQGDKYYIETVRQSDLFLASLGFLKGKPTI
ncbi:alpha/beta hydrolase [Flavobacterium fluviatile]|uniref:alpha/beta hydrolase n=1 Tax=Flavobacterium fluviatile TaxID=1862387 RepID=UPI0013D5EF48|nr:alpha/beta hydrolase fold domain-containing protein [Flavobacterium fluviatile]